MRYLSLLPLALLLGCAATDQAAVDAPVTNTSYLSVNRAFDVPSLLGLNANEIDRPLTTASVTPSRDLTPRQETSGATESMYTYWRDTTALVVSFDPATQRVNSFFVKTKSGLTSDYNTLLRLVGVSRFDKRLTIEPIASVSNPQYYTGVKIVPVR